MLGDFNINTRNNDNQITQQHLNTMASNNLHICDKNTITRTASNTTIDHIFTNNLNTQINLSYISHDILDHKIICIELTNTKVPNKKIQYTVKKINYKKLDHELTNKPIHIDNTGTINEMYDKLMNELQSHIIKCTTTTTYTKMGKTKPWIDQELIKIYETKNFWYTKKIKFPNNEMIKGEYTKARNAATKMARNKKKLFYEKRFKNSAGNNKKTWDTIKQVLYNGNKKPKINPIENMNNKLAFAKKLNKCIATIGRKLATKIKKTTATHYRMKTSARLKFVPINEAKIVETIGKINNSKAEGHDNITAEIIKNNIKHLKSNIKTIINKCIESGTIASNMKITKVTPVYKEGDPNDCSNYRPICLLPIINKILEKIINEQLLNYLEDNQLLCKQQYGFRQKSNTNTAIFDFTTSIQRALDRKKKTGAIFIDLKKAFETVDRAILLKKLSSYGILGQAHIFFQNYFMNRQQYIKSEETNTEMEFTNTGIPQGANLASTLFLIYINDISELNFDGNIILYADDMIIVTMADTINDLQKKMNENTKKLHSWMTTNKLTINASKTNYILFRTPMNQQFTLKYNGTTLERVTNVKYLGVYIDSELNWNTQIRKTMSNLSAITGIFRKISTFIPKEMKRQLFFAMFSSRLHYGILSWYSAFETNIKPLQIIQNKAIRNLFGYKNMESTEKIHTENNILTIKQHAHHSLAIHMHEIINKNILSNTSIQFNNEYHQYNTRRATNIHSNRKNTQRFGTKQALQQAIDIYNKLPNNMKNMNRKKFKLASRELFRSTFNL